MKKTFFEYESNLVTQVLGESIFESLHTYDMETGGDKEDMTELHMLEFMEMMLGEDKYNRYKDKLSSSWINRFFHTYQFYKYGKKVFRFEKNLTEMLMKTDLNNVEAEFLKPSFTSIYLEVPFDTFNKEIDGKNYSLYGIYLYDMPVEHIERHELDRQIGQGYTKFMRIHAIFTTNEIINKDTEFTFSLFSLLLKPGNLFEQLQQNYKRMNLDDNEAKLSDEIISFIVNAMLYLSSDKKVINFVEPAYLQLMENKKSSKKKKKLERKYENHSKLSYYQVGTNVTIDNKFSKKSISQASEKTEKKVRNSQWIVRGHWRNQACGEGLKERKYIWIKPHIKGNENETLITREYKVK